MGNRRKGRKENGKGEQSKERRMGKKRKEGRMEIMYLSAANWVTITTTNKKEKNRFIQGYI